MAYSVKDLTGQVFKRLTVLTLAHNNGRAHWLCRCECGNTVVVASNHLQKANGTASCGCARAKHGHAKHGRPHPMYRVWLAMRDRCNNPNNKHYKWYGGRGIRVDAAWDSFEQFLEDMGHRPTGASIDRIDNDGPYCKANCRWATKQEQMWNTSVARWLEHAGERKVLSEWARHFGVSAGHMHNMLKKHGEVGAFEHLAYKKRT